MAQAPDAKYHIPQAVDNVLLELRDSDAASLDAIDEILDFAKAMLVKGGELRDTVADLVRASPISHCERCRASVSFMKATETYRGMFSSFG